MLASENVAIEGTGHKAMRDVAPGEAIFVDLEGRVHARQCADEPAAAPLHVRVRLPGAARFGDGRRLGLPGAAEPGRDAGAAADQHHAAERHRRRDPDPRIQPPQRDAAGAEDRQALPRRLRQEPLRGPHLHHAGAGGAQEERAPEAQRHRRGVPRPQRAAGRRLHRARHHQQGDRADGARGRRAQGLHGQRRAAGALPQRVRHRHAHARRTDRAWPHDRGDPPVHRRRRADLPGRRRDEARGGRAEPGHRRLRGQLLRRRIHHRRHQPRPTSRPGNPAPPAARGRRGPPKRLAPGAAGRTGRS
jgi:hypothetical protein